MASFTNEASLLDDWHDGQVSFIEYYEKQLARQNPESLNVATEKPLFRKWRRLALDIFPKTNLGTKYFHELTSYILMLTLF